MSLLDSNPNTIPCSQPFVGGPSLTEVCVANQTVLFLSLLNVLLESHPKIGDPCGRVKPIERPRLSYDFIVVGGGAAGPIIASRLSEVKDWNVLLIEAGPDEPAGAEVPSNLQLYLNTELDWKYTTTNESHACLNTGGKCSWPRGKNLGGCTSHHGMAYHRGHPKDYDKWAMAGNDGWSWDEVFPYFLKSEDNREIGRVSKEYHGTGGLMTVERFPWHPKFANNILNGAEQAGLGVSEDLVGQNITGFTIAQTISKDGVRLSTGAAFLRPFRNRTNLHVALNSQVTEITTLGRTKGKIKATGVKYVSNGKRHTVRAKREVILSAGAINSPQLLLLSGIGPAKHLKEVGVRSVLDLPGVGENLHNHQSFGVDFTIHEPSVAELNLGASDLYLANQTGPMSGTGLAQVTGILPSNLTTPDDPDIQIFFAGFQAICNSNNRISDITTFDNLETVRFSSVNLQPRSRGRITLKSKDPFEHPVIWSNDLSDPEDVSIVLQGLHAIFKLANTTEMRNLGLNLVSPKIRQCSNYTYLSDEYWKCAIRYDTRPENHQTGTCKMGPSSDPLAVVDSKLKVHGIKQLRIADASVQPQVVSGNPVASVNMVAERCADFIKQEYDVDV